MGMRGGSDWRWSAAQPVIASHSRSKNGVASLAYGEAIQRARSAPTNNYGSCGILSVLLARLPARSWIASLRSQ
jgi:hypothetical protein